jgi:hypothetical protein
VVHALPMDVPTNLDTEGISPHYSRFVLRTPAVGTRCSQGSGYVTVKMARLIVFGTVSSGKERKDWKATQIHVGDGSWGVEEYHVPGWVKNYSVPRNRESSWRSCRPDRSNGTNETILDAIDDDADIVASSDVFRAFEADLRLFGSSAFQRSLPEDDPPK